MLELACACAYPSCLTQIDWWWSQPRAVQFTGPRGHVHVLPRLDSRTQLRAVPSRTRVASCPAAVSKLSRSDAGPVSRPQIVGKSAGLNQIKKAITTLQIAQFIVSETLAVSELFANGV